jgi:hypothetical protein
LKDGFLFVGNELALDFLNTRPVQDGEPEELLPNFSALLRWFQAAGVINSRQVGSLQRQWGGSANARRTTEAMRQLREKLRKEILDWERSGSVQHSALAELNKTDGRASHANPAEDEWKIVLDGTMVRTVRTRRLVCSPGAQCGDIVRDCGSQARPQVCAVRTAFL